MSLKLTQRHGSPNFYIRGSIRGFRVDESTGLSDRKAAQEALALRHAELVRESLHGAQSVKTFADAALSYMEAGGEKLYLAPLIAHFRETKLAQVGQDEIDAAAKKLGKKRGGKKRKALDPKDRKALDAEDRKSPATINRQIYTPVMAVLHHAAQKRWCSKPVVARPKLPQGRMRWLRHEEAERLIDAAPEHLRPLVVFLLLTGARLTEALYLDWSNVDLQRGRVSFLETKNGESRGVPLHAKVIEELIKLPGRQGAVFRRPDGQPYAGRGGLGGGQIKTAWGTMIKRAGIKDFHPHDCRHTWASWHYSENRDVFALMALGGWKSEKMVMRYAHLNQDHLAPSIDRIWGKNGGVAFDAAEKPFILKAVA
ncbi:MAG: Integrase protein [Caulobacter sp.]|nr:Integrase protein [Caulobacter sp.]